MPDGGAGPHALFPSSCEDCPSREPVAGNCDRDEAWDLARYFLRHPDAPCPVRSRTVSDLS